MWWIDPGVFPHISVLIELPQQRRADPLYFLLLRSRRVLAPSVTWSREIETVGGFIVCIRLLCQCIDHITCDSVTSPNLVRAAGVVDMQEPGQVTHHVIRDQPGSPPDVHVQLTGCGCECVCGCCWSLYMGPVMNPIIWGDQADVKGCAWTTKKNRGWPGCRCSKGKWGLMGCSGSDSLSSTTSCSLIRTQAWLWNRRSRCRSRRANLRSSLWGPDPSGGRELSLPSVCPLGDQSASLIRRGPSFQQSPHCVDSLFFVSPSDVGMGELKTRCLLQAVDGEVNLPRSAASRSKGEHEMPISYDNPDAHAFWHCVHLEMFAGLPVAFKEMIGMSFLSSVTLSFLPAAIPSCWSTYMSYSRSFGFSPFLLSPFCFSRGFRPSFYCLSPFALFLLCILSSFSVGHKNNRLFPTTAFFLSDFIAHIRRGN